MTRTHILQGWLLVAVNAAAVAFHFSVGSTGFAVFHALIIGVIFGIMLGRR